MSITFNRIGDVQLAQNNAAAALESFRKGLAAIQQAADADPGNTGWQRDIAVSYGKLSAALNTLGETEAALAALRQAQAIIERMASRFPDNGNWKRDLDWIAARMTEIAAATKK
jgi:tetratricopeptide (TPR) repeat protein